MKSTAGMSELSRTIQLAKWRRNPQEPPTSRQVAALVTSVFADWKVSRVERVPTPDDMEFRVSVASHAHPVLLRLYVTAAGACEKEVALTRMFEGERPGPKVPVAPLIHADGSQQTCPVPYSITGWTEGLSLSAWRRRVSPSSLPGAGFAVGGVLAAIHAHRFERPGFLRVAQPPPVDEGLPGRASTKPAGLEVFAGCPPFLRCMEYSLFHQGGERRLGPEVTSAVWALARRLAPDLDRAWEHPCLVHADLGADHILLVRQSRRWSVSAVLDWGLAMSGSLLLDIGSILRYSTEDFERAFELGYLEGGGELERHWRRNARVLDMMALCGGLPRASEALSTHITRLLMETVEASHSPSG